MSKLWTPEEVKILKQMYYYWGAPTDIALFLGRTRKAVNKKASRLGLVIKNGRAKTRNMKGRLYWYYCKDRQCVFPHRLLAEKMIGRKLTSEDIVHHLDGDSLNNRRSNLIVTTRAEHMGKYHLDICLEKLRKINGDGDIVRHSQ